MRKGSSRNTVLLFTDGACIRNPGCGGWGYILSFRGVRKESSGGDPDTTNNRMELTAVIKGLEALTRPCTIHVYTDSQYVRNAIEHGWLERWASNGWRSSSGKVKNKDLWQDLRPLLKKHQVTFNWVPGHSGITENERADRLARDAAWKTKKKRIDDK